MKSQTNVHNTELFLKIYRESYSKKDVKETQKSKSFSYRMDCT